MNGIGLEGSSLLLIFDRVRSATMSDNYDVLRLLSWPSHVDNFFRLRNQHMYARLVDVRKYIWREPIGSEETKCLPIARP